MKATFLISFALSLTIGAQAQDIASVLKSIEANNIGLQAVKATNDAELLDAKSQNTLDATSVEYSPFYASGVSGVATSELVVSQEFDFPTLYAARHKAEGLQKTALDLQYLSQRQDILLEAKKTCLDLIMQNQVKAMLTSRMSVADELLAVYEKRLAEGDATALDVNQIKMDRMSLQTEVAQCNAARHTLLQSLIALNGNKPIEFDQAEYTVGANYHLPNPSHQSIEQMETDIDYRAAQASAAASRQEVQVSKQARMPRLTVGYRRNTDMKEAFNGFMIGAAFPIFTTNTQVKAAQRRYDGAQLQMEQVRIERESSIRALVGEAQQLEQALSAYDEPLMLNTLALLQKAVNAGSITIMEFYAETDKVYQKQSEFIALQNQYQKVIAELRRNEL